LPAEPHPFIFDMGTAAVNHGDVVLASRLRQLLPEGVAVDAEGRPTRDPAAALAGGILPFGGHKGYGLSLTIQALGLLAGAALPRGEVQDFGFLFIVIDPGLLIPAGQFKKQLAELIDRVKATPRQPGVDEIRIPSERALLERERRRREGIVLERGLYDSIDAL
jgi:L-2-hydroxycarboxylate dehydrogenase (NAD+)